MTENKIPGMPESKVTEPGMPAVEEHKSPGLPEMNTPDKDVSNDVSIPMIPKSGIKVVATRKGFFGQLRRREGDEFVITSEKQFGDWFQCKDMIFEKKRKEFVKSRKPKAKR